MTVTVFTLWLQHLWWWWWHLSHDQWQWRMSDVGWHYVNDSVYVYSSIGDNDTGHYVYSHFLVISIAVVLPGWNILLVSIINSCVVAYQFAIGRDDIGGIPVVVWSMYIRTWWHSKLWLVTWTLHNYVFLTLVMLHMHMQCMCTSFKQNNTNTSTALFNWLNRYWHSYV